MRAWLLTAVLVACGGGSSGPPDAAGAAQPDAWEMRSDCTVDQAEALWDVTCTFGPCHGGSDPAAGLDLETPGSLPAMVGVESSECTGDILVVAGDPEASYLIEKLLPRPSCGNQMPPQQLSLDDVDCVRSAISKLVAQ